MAIGATGRLGMLEIQSSSWQLELAPNSGNECFVMSSLEFGDKTVTIVTPLAPVTAAVTYSRDGDKYSATLQTGQVLQLRLKVADLNDRAGLPSGASQLEQDSLEKLRAALAHGQGVWFVRLIACPSLSRLLRRDFGKEFERRGIHAVAQAGGAGPSLKTWPRCASHRAHKPRCES